MFELVVNVVEQDCLRGERQRGSSEPRSIIPDQLKTSERADPIVGVCVSPLIT